MIKLKVYEISLPDNFGKVLRRNIAYLLWPLGWSDTQTYLCRVIQDGHGKYSLVDI